MPTDRNLSNTLALAVLALLCERPRHPYEIGFVMRSRGIDRTVKLNRGSLYTVVEALHRGGLIVPQETYREGRRPERTVYMATDAGREKLTGWLRHLLSRPVTEHMQFAAGLAFAARFPVPELIDLLERRLRVLEDEVGEARYELDALAERVKVPRFFLIEQDYGLTLREAEADWLRKLLRELRDGTLAPPDPKDLPEFPVADTGRTETAGQ